ncbi:MAG: PEP/pyruvate-binding domain-containing protein [Elusimicrobiota bacterium]
MPQKKVSQKLVSIILALSMFFSNFSWGTPISRYLRTPNEKSVAGIDAALEENDGKALEKLEKGLIRELGNFKTTVSKNKFFYDLHEEKTIDLSDAAVKAKLESKVFFGVPFKKTDKCQLLYFTGVPIALVKEDEHGQIEEIKTIVEELDNIPLAALMDEDRIEEFKKNGGKAIDVVLNAYRYLKERAKLDVPARNTADYRELREYMKEFDLQDKKYKDRLAELASEVERIEAKGSKGNKKELAKSKTKLQEVKKQYTKFVKTGGLALAGGKGKSSSIVAGEVDVPDGFNVITTAYFKSIKQTSVIKEGELNLEALKRDFNRKFGQKILWDVIVKFGVKNIVKTDGHTDFKEIETTTEEQLDVFNRILDGKEFGKEVLEDFGKELGFYVEGLGSLTEKQLAEFNQVLELYLEQEKLVKSLMLKELNIKKIEQIDSVKGEKIAAGFNRFLDKHLFDTAERLDKIENRMENKKVLRIFFSYAMERSHNDVWEIINDKLGKLDTSNDGKREYVADEIRAAIKENPLPADVEKEVSVMYMLMNVRRAMAGKESPTRVAVRSSGVKEDIDVKSWVPFTSGSQAGMSDTFLNIKGTREVLKRLVDDWASLFTDRAISYRDDQIFLIFTGKLGVNEEQSKEKYYNLLGKFRDYSRKLNRPEFDALADILTGLHNPSSVVLKNAIQEILVYEPDNEDLKSALLMLEESAQEYVDAGEISIDVLVMQMVESYIAGVLFSVDPATGMTGMAQALYRAWYQGNDKLIFRNEDTKEITGVRAAVVNGNLSFGLGEAVVSGGVNADNITVGTLDGENWMVLNKTKGDKRRQMIQRELAMKRMLDKLYLEKFGTSSLKESEINLKKIDELRKKSKTNLYLLGTDIKIEELSSIGEAELLKKLTARYNQIMNLQDKKMLLSFYKIVVSDGRLDLTPGIKVLLKEVIEQVSAKKPLEETDFVKIRKLNKQLLQQIHPSILEKSRTVNKLAEAFKFATSYEEIDKTISRDLGVHLHGTRYLKQLRTPVDPDNLEVTETPKQMLERSKEIADELAKKIVTESSTVDLENGTSVERAIAKILAGIREEFNVLEGESGDGLKAPTLRKRLEKLIVDAKKAQIGVEKGRKDLAEIFDSAEQGETFIQMLQEVRKKTELELPEREKVSKKLNNFGVKDITDLTYLIDAINTDKPTCYIETSDAHQDAFCITDSEIVYLAEMVWKVVDLYKFPIDIEFGIEFDPTAEEGKRIKLHVIDENGKVLEMKGGKLVPSNKTPEQLGQGGKTFLKLYNLQARPYTAKRQGVDYMRKGPEVDEDFIDKNNIQPLTTGTKGENASIGYVFKPDPNKSIDHAARQMERLNSCTFTAEDRKLLIAAGLNPDEYGIGRKYETLPVILYLKEASPEHDPLMKRAAAVITDEGGDACHAAIYCREQKIPAVTGIGVKGAEAIKGHFMLVVDATNGRIFRFEQEEKKRIPLIYVKERIKPYGFVGDEHGVVLPGFGHITASPEAAKMMSALMLCKERITGDNLVRVEFKAEEMAINVFAGYGYDLMNKFEADPKTRPGRVYVQDIFFKFSKGEPTGAPKFLAKLNETMYEYFSQKKNLAFRMRFQTIFGRDYQKEDGLMLLAALDVRECYLKENDLTHMAEREKILKFVELVMTETEEPKNYLNYAFGVFQRRFNYDLNIVEALEKRKSDIVPKIADKLKSKGYTTFEDYASKEFLYFFNTMGFTTAPDKSAKIRVYDFAPDKISGLIGSEIFSYVNYNPFTGLRGASLELEGLVDEETEQFEGNQKVLKFIADTVNEANKNTGNLAVFYVFVRFLREVELIDRMFELMAQRNGGGNRSLPKEIGIMVEVPSDALLAKEFAIKMQQMREKYAKYGVKVTFYSFGTNDLSNLVGVCDREDPKTIKFRVIDPYALEALLEIKSKGYYYNEATGELPLVFEGAPGMFRVMEAVVKRAREFGVMVDLCGEAPNILMGLKRFKEAARMMRLLRSCGLSKVSFIQLAMMLSKDAVSEEKVITTPEKDRKKLVDLSGEKNKLEQNAGVRAGRVVYINSVEDLIPDTLKGVDVKKLDELKEFIKLQGPRSARSTMINFGKGLAMTKEELAIEEQDLKKFEEERLIRAIGNGQYVWTNLDTTVEKISTQLVNLGYIGEKQKNVLTSWQKSVEIVDDEKIIVFTKNLVAMSRIEFAMPNTQFNKFIQMGWIKSVGKDQYIWTNLSSRKSTFANELKEHGYGDAERNYALEDWDKAWNNTAAGLERRGIDWDDLGYTVAILTDADVDLEGWDVLKNKYIAQRLKIKAEGLAGRRAELEGQMITIDYRNKAIYQGKLPIKMNELELRDLPLSADGKRVKVPTEKAVPDDANTVYSKFKFHPLLLLGYEQDKLIEVFDEYIKKLYREAEIVAREKNEKTRQVLLSNFRSRIDAIHEPVTREFLEVVYKQLDNGKTKIEFPAGWDTKLRIDYFSYLEKGIKELLHGRSAEEYIKNAFRVQMKDTLSKNQGKLVIHKTASLDCAEFGKRGGGFLVEHVNPNPGYGLKGAARGIGDFTPLNRWELEVWKELWSGLPQQERKNFGLQITDLRGTQSGAILIFWKYLLKRMDIVPGEDGLKIGININTPNDTVTVDILFNEFKDFGTEKFGKGLSFVTYNQFQLGAVWSGTDIDWEERWRLAKDEELVDLGDKAIQIIHHYVKAENDADKTNPKMVIEFEKEEQPLFVSVGSNDTAQLVDLSFKKGETDRDASSDNVKLKDSITELVAAIRPVDLINIKDVKYIQKLRGEAARAIRSLGLEKEYQEEKNASLAMALLISGIFNNTQVSKYLLGFYDPKTDPKTLPLLDYKLEKYKKQLAADLKKIGEQMKINRATPADNVDKKLNIALAKAMLPTLKEEDWKVFDELWREIYQQKSADKILSNIVKDISYTGEKDSKKLIVNPALSLYRILKAINRLSEKGYPLGGKYFTIDNESLRKVLVHLVLLDNLKFGDSKAYFINAAKELGNVLDAVEMETILANATGDTPNLTPADNYYLGFVNRALKGLASEGVNIEYAVQVKIAGLIKDRNFDGQDGLESVLKEELNLDSKKIWLVKSAIANEMDRKMGKDVNPSEDLQDSIRTVVANGGEMTEIIDNKDSGIFITEAAMKKTIGLWQATREFAGGLEKEGLGKVKVYVEGDADALKNLGLNVTVIDKITKDEISKRVGERFSVIAVGDDEIKGIDSGKIIRLAEIGKDENKIILAPFALVKALKRLVGGATNAELENIALGMLKELQLSGCIDKTVDLAAIAKQLIIGNTVPAIAISKQVGEDRRVFEKLAQKA